MLAPYARHELGKLRAVALNVLVEPEEPPKRLIHVIANGEDAYRVGRVVSIGKDGIEKLRGDLQVGDRVLYAQGVAATTAIEGLHVVTWDHVYAVLEGSGEVEARAVAPGHGQTVQIGRERRRE